MLTAPRGLFTALVTPFRERDIDWEALARIAEAQKRANVDGLVLMGTTAEVFALSDVEQARIFAALRNQLGSGISLWVGCGTSSTQTTVERVRRAEKMGADGAMIVVPPYVKPNASGIHRHFAEICAACSLPIMLYNNPGRAAISLDLTTLIDLCRFDQVVAIKESGCDLHRIVELLRQRPERVSIFAGEDAWIAPMLALGADGAVSVSANAFPDALYALVEMGRASSTAIWREFYRLWPLFRALDVETNPLVIKYLMHRRGLCAPDVRAPLGPMSEAAIKSLEPLFDDSLFTKTPPTP